MHTGWSEKYLFWIQTRQSQGKMPSHNRTHVPGLLKGELPTDEESDIVQLSEDNNDVVVDIKPEQELKQEVKCFVAGTVQKLVTGAKKTLVQKRIKTEMPKQCIDLYTEFCSFNYNYNYSASIRKVSVHSKHPYFGSRPRIPISLHSLWEILCIIQLLVLTPNRTYTSNIFLFGMFGRIPL